MIIYSLIPYHPHRSTIMKSKLILGILIAIQAISYGLKFTQNGNELVFKTKRTQIKIVDARITEFRLRRGQGIASVSHVSERCCDIA